MTDYKRIPKISSTIKRLIAAEALRHPDMPRVYLAKILTEKIEALGERPPAEETLLRKISEARSRKPVQNAYWHLGLQASEIIPVPAVARIIQIRRTLKEKHNLLSPPKVPERVAYWIGQLHQTIADNETLFTVAYAYSVFESISFAADGNLEVVDTTELDDLLVEENYGAFATFVIGIRFLSDEMGNDYVIKEFEGIKSRFTEIINKPEDVE